MIHLHHTRRWLLLALVLFSFGASLFFSRAVFEHLPHLEDELAYTFQAHILARGDLVAPTPPQASAFWQPFVLDRNGHRFGKYPLGWPAQLAVGEVLGAPWIVNAWLAAATTALVYCLGSAIFNRDAGLIAAALVAFSPMALLLSGTLMGHTSALCFSTLLLYAAWRMEHSKRHTLRWALLAGVALGMIIANRPMSGLAVGIPVIVWKGARLLPALVHDLRERGSSVRFAQTLPLLRPLIAMGIVAGLFAATIPLFSAITVGDPSVNLYTQVWAYDRIGFGECCGVSGHTLEKGFNHLGWDLSLTAADLFGWQAGTFTDEAILHLQQDSDTYPNLGLSWLLLPFGLWIVHRNSRRWLIVWIVAGVIWISIGTNQAAGFFATPVNAWIWIIVALAWALAPIAITALRGKSEQGWVWIVTGVALCILIVHMTYWVGSQRYSTRYYFEALLPIALISAVPVAWAIRVVRRAPVYLAVAAVCLFSFISYSLPRIDTLYGFNNVTQAWITEAMQQRQGDCPLLVIVTGTDLSWRSMGTFMAATSPYVDSDIIAAFNRVQDASSPGLRDQVIAAFPDRQVIDLRGQGIEADFVASETPAAGCPTPPAS
ncbi:MAG: glycosyltransferase family 39 protein [Anaerolineae bacterium]|nr:glycosyltransferase family 39 protein [Anaerolineae bacterium]